MTSMNTKAQDGLDGSRCLLGRFNTVGINRILVQGPCDSKFWSEADRLQYVCGVTSWTAVDIDARVLTR